MVNYHGPSGICFNIETIYMCAMNKINDVTGILAGVYNRKFFIEMIENPETLKNDLCITVIDVNGLKETNDSLGHAAGDEMICAVSALAKQAFGKDAFISRMGGDEFSVLTYGSREEMKEKMKNMKALAANYQGKLINKVSFSVGIACRSEFTDLTPEGLFQTADQLMYEDKAAYYKRSGIDRRRR